MVKIVVGAVITMTALFPCCVAWVATVGSGRGPAWAGRCSIARSIEAGVVGADQCGRCESTRLFSSRSGKRRPSGGAGRTQGAHAAAVNRRRKRRAASRRAAAASATEATVSPRQAGPRLGSTTKQSERAMLDAIERPLTTTVDAAAADLPMGDELSAPIVETIVRAADMRKAENCVALRVSRSTALCTFLVIVSGNSRPQNQAIAAAIMDDVEEFHDGMKTKNSGVPEGTADSGWILLDYGDVMVHIMTPKSRLFYDIEGQWREKGGEYMDLTTVLLPDAPNQSIPMQDQYQQYHQQIEGHEYYDDQDIALGGGMANIEPEDDPFWS